MHGGGWLRVSLQREGHRGAEIPQQELRVGLSTLPTPFLPWGRLSPCPPFPRCSPLLVGPPEERGGMRVGRQLCGEGVPRPFLGGHTERWVVWPPAAGGFGGARRRRGAGAGCVGGCGVAQPQAPAAMSLLCPQAVCGGDRVPLLLCVCGGTGVTQRGWEGVPGAATGPPLAWLWDPAAPPGCGLGAWGHPWDLGLRAARGSGVLLLWGAGVPAPHYPKNIKVGFVCLLGSDTCSEAPFPQPRRPHKHRSGDWPEDGAQAGAASAYLSLGGHREISCFFPSLTARSAFRAGKFC